MATFAEQMLEKIENMILGKSDATLIYYNGTRIEKSDMGALLDAREKLRREVAIEQKLATTGIPRIVTRF